MIQRLLASIRKGFQTWAGMPLALFMLVFVILQGVVMASAHAMPPSGAGLAGGIKPMGSSSGGSSSSLRCIRR